jgi:hypothetical protein
MNAGAGHQPAGAKFLGQFSSVFVSEKAPRNLAKVLRGILRNRCNHWRYIDLVRHNKYDLIVDFGCNWQASVLAELKKTKGTKG